MADAHKFRWTTRFIDPYRVGIWIHPNVRGGIYNFWIDWTLGQSKCLLSTLKPWMLLNVGWYYSRYSRFISPSPAVKRLSESLPRKTRADSLKGFNSCYDDAFCSSISPFLEVVSGCFTYISSVSPWFGRHFITTPPPRWVSRRGFLHSPGGSPRWGGGLFQKQKCGELRVGGTKQPRRLECVGRCRADWLRNEQWRNGFSLVNDEQMRGLRGSVQVGKRHETESKTSMFCFLFKILWKACQKHMEKHEHYHRRFQGLAAHQKVDPLGIPSCFQNFCLVSFSPNRIHGSGIFSIIFLHLHSFDGCWLFEFQVYNYWRGELLEIGVVSVRFQRNILNFKVPVAQKLWFHHVDFETNLNTCQKRVSKPLGNLTIIFFENAEQNAVW